MKERTNEPSCLPHTAIIWLSACLPCQLPLRSNSIASLPALRRRNRNLWLRTQLAGSLAHWTETVWRARQLSVVRRTWTSLIMPDRMPDEIFVSESAKTNRTPDRTTYVRCSFRICLIKCQIACQVDCQLKCQIECQIKRQKECQMKCQNICQIAIIL